MFAMTIIVFYNFLIYKEEEKNSLIRTASLDRHRKWRLYLMEVTIKEWKIKAAHAYYGRSSSRLPIVHVKEDMTMPTTMAAWGLFTSQQK